MPIKGLAWQPPRGRFDPSRDRHVLRTEVSPSLLVDGTIVVTPETGPAVFVEDYLSGATDVELEFEPLFRSTRGAGSYSGFGIHVDFTTGAVSCDPGPPPPNAPANFLIRLSVTKNVGGSLAPEKIPPLLLRVHLHDLVTRLKLTPPELTIHRLAPGTREATTFAFTAYAEFDDATVGDVTLNHGLTWTADSASDEIQANGFVTLVPANAPPQSFKVTATTPAAWGSLQAKGTVRVAQPWSAATPPPTAILLQGPAESWTIGHRADRRANILFLGCGFPATDADRFTQLVTQISHWMKRDNITSPYDLLADSINLWRLHVPAAARGISIRCEVALRDEGGRTVALPLGPTRKPPEASGPAWEVPHLFFAVGLPLPTDFGRDPTTLRNEFGSRALPEFALDLLDKNRVPDSVILGWRERARRTFVEQLDTFPPLAIGRPPSVAADVTNPEVDLHDDRGGDEYLGAFLRTIVGSDGATAGSAAEPLGVIWAEARAEFAFDNRPMLTLLGALSMGRANHGETRQHLVLEPGSRGPGVQVFVGTHTVRLDLKDADLGFELERQLWRVFAHELSHVILGDEYVEAAVGFKLDDDPAGTVFDGFSNVQSLRSLLAPSTEPDLTKRQISGELIKWRWPRIRKAAVIDGAISESSLRFTVPLLRHHGAQFAAGDRVRFRSRPVRGALRRFDPSVDVSTGEFTVTGVTTTPLGDSITMTLASGAETLATLGRFVPGSLVFQPVDPPSSIPRHEYPYAELLTDAVRREITDTGEPLTDWPCDPAFEFAHKADLQIPRYDALSLLFSRRNTPRLVGLYSGGAGYACGVFHPTGLCIMRNHREPKGKEGSDEFCAVCRYALVDFFDPTRHATIEATLAKRGFE